MVFMPLKFRCRIDTVRKIGKDVFMNILRKIPAVIVAKGTAAKGTVIKQVLFRYAICLIGSAMGTELPILVVRFQDRPQRQISISEESDI